VTRRSNRKHDDADRDPESKGKIHERRQEKARISIRYREAERKLPDDLRDLRLPTEPPETRQVFADVLGAGWSTADAD
jgi:hypothetical protein